MTGGKLHLVALSSVTLSSVISCSPQCFLISLQGTLSCHFMVHHRLVPEALILRHPMLYISQFLIKLLGLCSWIEHAEVRRSVTARTGAPLPAAIVGSIVVVQ